MRTVNQRRSPRVATSFSLKHQRAQDLARVVPQLGVVEVGGEVGDRPAHVAGDELDELVACVVKRRMRSSSSRKSVAMSVLLSRFFMSLLARDSSSTLACSSALTVCSSSFIDCISSLEVVSSSLVDWSSSLVDCSSSLAGPELLLGGLHLLAGGLRSPRGACCTSRFELGEMGADDGLCAGRCASACARAAAATSLNTISTLPRRLLGLEQGWTVRSTVCAAAVGAHRAGRAR